MDPVINKRKRGYMKPNDKAIGIQLPAGLILVGAVFSFVFNQLTGAAAALAFSVLMMLVGISITLVTTNAEARRHVAEMMTLLGFGAILGITTSAVFLMYHSTSWIPIAGMLAVFFMCMGFFRAVRMQIRLNLQNEE